MELLEGRTLLRPFFFSSNCFRLISIVCFFVVPLSHPPSPTLETRQNLLRRTLPVRRSLDVGGSRFQLTYAAPPGALCSFRSSRATGHAPTVCRPASLPARHPQSSPRAASCYPPSPPLRGDVRRALSQSRNCSSSFNRPSFRIQRPATQYAVCCRLSSISFLHKFSFVSAVWVSAAPATPRRSARRHLLTPFRPGSTRTSFRRAETRSQTPPRAASCDPQAPATGDVRRALSQERNCAVRPLRKLRSRPPQILPCQRDVGGGYSRHGALQPPLRSAHRPALAGALMLFSLRSKTSSPDPASLPGQALRGAPRKFGSSASKALRKPG
ncbi:hypothetical protein PDESU_06174 [Pontiella desulfatans]|uniref:Uncharacterized protein n=1 Tax=Pontiella desulfatans TaxID=2750659 RepID=A0A6C2UED4_PONDE|nr:hypothetical protein PDESU_06174 [Pontiella desulfatans]